MGLQNGALCVVLGGGGHAQVVIDVVQLNGAATLIGVLDADAGRWGCEIFGVRILGGDDMLGELRSRGASCFVVGAGSVGDPTVRRRLFALGLAHGLEPLTVRHPSAVCSVRAAIGRGSQILSGAILNAGSRLGQNVIVNSGAIVEHDCVVGDHAHIATGACLASTVQVGFGAHVGAGASVRQGTRIGDGAIVGLGAAVVRDVEAGTIVVGVPARPLALQDGSAATRSN